MLYYNEKINNLRKRWRFLSLTGLGIIFLTTYFLLPTPAIAQAPTDYKMLAPIPQLLKTDSADSTNAAAFLPGLIKLIIGLATALAVIMLMWGGIQYMSTDAWAGKSEAKDTITNALVGLLLVISAWLILYTINPKLVEINLNIPPQEIKTSPPPPPGGGGPRVGVPMTAAEIAASNQVRSRLEDPNVGVKINAGPCTQGEGYGCTNLNGLPEAAIQGLINLKKDCKCVIRVSGGTEPGPHQTHGVGKAVVDLSNDPSLKKWLTDKKFLIPNGNGAVVTLTSGSRVAFVFERVGQGNSTGDHWHLVF